MLRRLLLRNVARSRRTGRPLGPCSTTRPDRSACASVSGTGPGGQGRREPAPGLAAVAAGSPRWNQARAQKCCQRRCFNLELHRYSFLRQSPQTSWRKPLTAPHDSTASRLRSRTFHPSEYQTHQRTVFAWQGTRHLGNEGIRRLSVEVDRASRSTSSI